MNTTSLGLLQRLQGAEPTAPEWRQLHDLYRPLIAAWLAGVPGLRDEADDLIQEVLLVLCRELAGFERQRQGSFRAWLRQITVHRIRAFWKSQQKRRPARGGDDHGPFLSQLEDPTSDLARQWDREHDQHVFQKLLALVQPDFATTTWQAFRRFALEGRPAAQVAEELKMSENAVIQAKSRILKRLRQEAGDFLE